MIDLSNLMKTSLQEVYALASSGRHAQKEIFERGELRLAADEVEALVANGKVGGLDSKQSLGVAKVTDREAANAVKRWNRAARRKAAARKAEQQKAKA